MQNKITIKRISAILFSIFILWIEMSQTSVVFASQNEEINNDFINEESCYEEVGYILGYFGYESNEEIYCSQLLDIENENDDSKAMLVFEDEDIIGLLSTSVIDDEVIYSFIYNDFEELNNTNFLEKEVAIANIDENIVFITDDNEEIIVYEENGNNNTKETDLIQYDKIETESIELVPLPQDVIKEIDIVASADDTIYEESNTDTSKYTDVTMDTSYANDRYHTAYYMINVPYVSNDKVNDSGLCWAATGASLSNYFKRTNYTARNIYDNLNKKYTGEPVGSNEWYKRMLSMLGLKYNFYERKLSYNEVYSSLKSGRPIKIGISDGSVAHAIILCGTFIYLNDAKYYYVYRDPTFSGYIVNSIVESTRTTNSGTTFYFKVSGLYNNWNNSYIVYK